MIDDKTLDAIVAVYASYVGHADKRAMRAAIEAARLNQGCPHVFTSNQGTQHCTLASVDVARADYNRAKALEREQQAKEHIRKLEAALREIMDDIEYTSGEALVDTMNKAEAILATTSERSEDQQDFNQHPDNSAVDRFAAQMKEKLASARSKGRGGWADPAQCSGDHLAGLLADHVYRTEPGNWLDIANFAMMLQERNASTELLRDALVSKSEQRSEDEQGSADEEADQALMDLVWDALKVSPRQSVNRREETLRRALRQRRVPEEIRKELENMRAEAERLKHRNDGLGPDRTEYAEAHKDRCAGRVQAEIQKRVNSIESIIQRTESGDE